MMKRWFVVAVLFLPYSPQMQRADAALVCIATPLADASSIELTTSARSGMFGAMGVVA